MKSKNIIGAWAFLIGVILAVLAGIGWEMGWIDSAGQGWPIALVIFGIIVGFINITGQESEKFILAGTALVVVSFFGGQYYMGLISLVGNIVKALVILFVPATIIVILRAVFNLAKK